MPSTSTPCLRAKRCRNCSASSKISSLCSRSGDTQMGTTFRRKNKSWRNSFRSTLSSKWRLVVAITLTSTYRHLEESVERKDRKSTRLNSSHVAISYAVFCLKKKKNSDCRNGQLVD